MAKGNLQREIRRAHAAARNKASRAAILSLTGDKQLVKQIDKFKDGVGSRVMGAGLKKAARVVVKSIKARVPADLKQIKPLFGSSVGNAKGGSKRGQFQAKAGAAVGKAFKKEAKRSGQEGAKQRGVGISGANIHWWLMGTQDRHTRYGPTGSMPSQAPDIVKEGTEAAKPEVKAVLVKHLTSAIASLNKHKSKNRR